MESLRSALSNRKPAQDGPKMYLRSAGRSALCNAAQRQLLDAAYGAVLEEGPRAHLDQADGKVARKEGPTLPPSDGPRFPTPGLGRVVDEQDPDEVRYRDGPEDRDRPAVRGQAAVAEGEGDTHMMMRKKAMQTGSIAAQKMTAAVWSLRCLGTRMGTNLNGGMLVSLLASVKAVRGRSSRELLSPLCSKAAV